MYLLLKNQAVRQFYHWLWEKLAAYPADNPSVNHRRFRRSDYIDVSLILLPKIRLSNKACLVGGLYSSTLGKGFGGSGMMRNGKCLSGDNRSRVVVFGAEIAFRFRAGSLPFYFSGAVCAGLQVLLL